MNPALLLKAKIEKDKFIARHPKFVPFLKAAQRSVIQEGAVLEIKITAPDGQTLETNVKMSAEDMKAYQELTDLLGL